MKTLLRNIGQIFNPSLPSKGEPFVDHLEDKCLIIDKGRIESIVSERTVDLNSADFKVMDALSATVIPGFVDPHTHILYCGRRTGEFYMRLAGKTYLEILREGGGILKTVNSTRMCDTDALLNETLPRIRNAVSNGTTTMEIKTGYGLDKVSELKMLQCAKLIRKMDPLRVVITALPLHAVPEGMNEVTYLNEALENILPEMAEDSDFLDIFCDAGSFSPESLRKIGEFSSSTGIPLRIHAGEIDNIGCIPASSEFKVLSYDHILHVDQRDIEIIREKRAYGTILPITAFVLGERMPDARRLIDGGIRVSIGSDSSPLNPSQNMLFAQYLAVRFCKMKPEEAFIASTVNAAGSLGMVDTVGSIEPGKCADLVMLGVNDLDDIPFMWNSGIVRCVIHNGIKVSGDSVT